MNENPEVKLGPTAKEVLKYLQQGHTLTLLDAVRIFGTVSLRERIRDIREAGYPVKTRNDKNPNTGHYHAVYSLQQPTTVEEIYART
jgi:hypothetical protein